MSDLALDTLSDMGQESQRGPGRWLREVREQKHWTQEHVANQLRLPVRMVQALEQDDYHRLPPSTFVRGYLRNYARLVDIPEQDVIAKYIELQGNVDDVRLPRYTAPSQVTSRDSRVRWVTYLVVLSVIALSLIWWRTQWYPGSLDIGGMRSSDSVPAPLRSEPGAEPESLVQGPSKQVVVDGATSVQTEAQPLAGTPTGGPTATVTAPPAIPGPAPIPGSAPDAQASLEPGAGPAEDMALLDIAPSTTPPAGPGSVPPQATDKPKQDTVVLRFEDDSWAEITDAEDKRLLYGTISKGSTKTVQGKSPFKVVLGRSNAVKIEYNGQPFDYRFSEKRGTARFELGAPQQQAGAQRLGPVSPPRIGSTSTAPPRAEPAGAE